MRSASPTYSGLSSGIDMGLPRERQHESQEPRLLREVVRAIQRLDPAAPDPLRGGVRFRVVGPQIPKNEVIKLYALLWDPSIKPMTAGFGTRPDAQGREFPQAPGSFPIQIDGTAWVGVADGKYRIAVIRRNGAAPARAIRRRLRKMWNSISTGLPADVEIRGQTIEIPIPSYLLAKIDLLSPRPDEAIDLRTVTFRWSSLPKAKSYFVGFGWKEEIPGGSRTNFSFNANTAETSFSLKDLPAADTAKLKPLQARRQGHVGRQRIRRRRQENRQL